MSDNEYTPKAQLIHDTIEAMPHARRLYPDLYCEELAAAISDDDADKDRKIIELEGLLVSLKSDRGWDHAVGQKAQEIQANVIEGLTRAEAKITAASGFIDQLVGANQDSQPEAAWRNDNVLEMLVDIRSTLTATSQIQPDRVEQKPVQGADAPMADDTDCTPTVEVARGHYAWKSESIAAATSYLEGQAQFDRMLATVRAEVKADVVAQLRWLAAARAEYDHIPEGGYHSATASDQLVHHEHRGVSGVADILEGISDGMGWLPSWRWDEWQVMRDGAN